MDGCFKANERKVWSVRRNDTRFNGDPRDLLGTYLNRFGGCMHQRSNSQPPCQIYGSTSSLIPHERAPGDQAEVQTLQRSTKTEDGKKVEKVLC